MEYSGNPQMDLSLCCMHGYLTINYDCHSYPWKLLGTTIQREDSPVDQVGSVWVLGSGD